MLKFWKDENVCLLSLAVAILVHISLCRAITMAEPSAQHGIDTIQGLTKPSTAQAQEQLWETAVACQAAKAVMMMSVKDLLKDASGLPVLTSKSCDGTPMSVTHRSKRALPSGTAIRSSGKKGVEVLVKNQFFRAFIPGVGTQTRVLIGEGTSLEYGKSVQAILGAA